MVKIKREQEIMELSMTLSAIMDNIGGDEKRMQELMDFLSNETETMLEKAIEKFQK